MSTGIAPDEREHFEAKAAPIGVSSVDDRNSTSSAGVLTELSRLIERVSKNGVRSPVDKALLKGAKEIFSSLLETCESLSKKEAEAPDESQVSQEDMMNAFMMMSIAGLGDDDDVGDIVDAGPSSDDAKKKTATKRTRKKATSRKKSSSRRKSAKKKS